MLAGSSAKTLCLPSLTDSTAMPRKAGTSGQVLLPSVSPLTDLEHVLQ